MSNIYESMNKGFENKYGKGEHGYSKPKNKAILEKTTPEDRANSDKLKELSKKAWYDNGLTDEDKKFIDDMGFEVRMGGYIVPKGTPEREVSKYEVKPGIWDYNPSQDVTGLSRKLQRATAGTTNPVHGYGRSSEEEKRISQSLDDAKRWGTDRSQKVLQTKLDKQKQTLRDYRRKNTYQDIERARETQNITEPVRKFKSIQGYLDPESKFSWGSLSYKDRSRNIAADKEIARSDYEARLAELDRRQEAEDKRKADFEAEKARLLRRTPKNESLLKEGAESDVYNYLSLIRKQLDRMEEGVKSMILVPEYILETLQDVYDVLRSDLSFEE